METHLRKSQCRDSKVTLLTQPKPETMSKMPFDSPRKLKNKVSSPDPAPDNCTKGKENPVSAAEGSIHTCHTHKHT